MPGGLSDMMLNRRRYICWQSRKIQMPLWENSHFGHNRPHRHPQRGSVPGRLQNRIGKNSFSRVEDLFDPQLSAKNGDAFQILCYVFLYGQTFTSDGLPLPLLYYMNSPFSRKTTGKIRYNRANLNNRQDLAEIEEQFLALLSNLLEELFNFNIPFKQTDFVDNCVQCPFISICQREKYND